MKIINIYMFYYKKILRLKKYICMLICIMFLLCGCTTKQNKEEAEIRNKMLPVAKTYIKTKYGFELLEDEIERFYYPCINDINFGCIGKNGTLDILATHNGKEYKIRVRSNNEHSDTYEVELIKDKVKTYIGEYFELNPNEFEVDISSYYENNFNNEFFHHVKVSETDDINQLVNTIAYLYIYTYKDLDKSKVDNLHDYIERLNEVHYYKIRDYETYNDYLEKALEEGTYHVLGMEQFLNNLSDIYTKYYR